MRQYRKVHLTKREEGHHYDALLFLYLVMDNLQYLGKGEKYPFQPNVNGGVALISDYELIMQSMEDIIKTPLGTQFPNESYGSRIYQLTFKPNDAILKSLLSYFISEALFIWEKRIRVIGIDCTRIDPSTMNCIVRYRVLASNEIQSFVYPYYTELKT